MTPYTDRRNAGHYDADTQTVDPDELPGRHAPLDDLATQHGHTWSADSLTVAEKQAELKAISGE